MPPKATQSVDLYVALFEDGTMYKHWGLFIDDKDSYTMLNARGSQGNWRFEEMSHHNVRDEQDLVATLKVAPIRKSWIPRLKDAAAKLELDRSPSWNCQSYVLDLIIKADELGLIDIDQDDLDALAARQDGLA